MCLVRRKKAGVEETRENRGICGAGLAFLLLFLDLQIHPCDFYLLQGILSDTEYQERVPQTTQLRVFCDALVRWIVFITKVSDSGKMLERYSCFRIERIYRCLKS